MDLFKKRETLVQNIAFMAIMSAINVVFVLLSNILPVLLFLLVFVLPLTSVMVTILCKKSLYPIYLISTLALCFVVTIGFNIFDTFIYVLPSLITGFIFGICIEKKVPVLYMILGGTVFQYLFTLLTFFVLGKIVTNLDLTNSIIVAFGLGDYEFKGVIVQVFLLIVSEIQIILSTLFLKFGMKRLGIYINLYCKYDFINYLIQILLGSLAILSYFYFYEYTINITILALTVYIYQVISLILKKKIWIYVSLIAVHFVFIFLFAFLFTYVSNPNHIILIFILFGMVTIIDLLSNYCFKQNKNGIK